VSDLWTEASRDVEGETQQRRLTAARHVVLPVVWPVLAGATTPTDYINRKALVADKIDHAIAGLAEGVDFAVLRAEVEASLDADFDVLRRAQQAAEAKRRPLASRKMRVRAVSAGDAEDLSEFGTAWAPWEDERLGGEVNAAIADLSASSSPEEIVKRLGNAFANAGGYQDSIDREHAFSLAARATDTPYNDIYDAWMAADRSWGDVTAGRRTAIGEVPPTAPADPNAQAQST